MFGFLIALPGGKKIRGGGGVGAEQQSQACCAPFIPCSVQWGGALRALCTCIQFSRGYREGLRVARLLLPCSFFLQGCAKSWGKKHPERSTRGRKQRGGGVIETCAGWGAWQPAPNLAGSPQLSPHLLEVWARCHRPPSCARQLPGAGRAPAAQPSFHSLSQG